MTMFEHYYVDKYTKYTCQYVVAMEQMVRLINVNHTI